MSTLNLAPTRRPAARFSDGAFLATALLVLGLTALVAIGARTWIDQPFAGFFLRADRTVAPVGRSAWTNVTPSRLYDRTLLAVDGTAIVAPDDLHRRVGAKPTGASFTYTLTDGRTTEIVTIPSRRFSEADYWAIFGAYLGTGICYVLLAIFAVWALPAQPLGRALLFLGGIGGVFMVTSADLYPPAGSLRIHVLAASLLPAALVQFALTVGDTRGRFTEHALPIAWAVALAAAASMQLLLGDPTATRAVHATCDAALGLALIAAAIGLSARVRAAQEGAPLLAGTALFGLGVPAVIFLLAGMLGGVPQNASATLAFLFPLGMSAALLRNETFVDAGDVARAARSL